ncbi:MAG: hypothetical protein FWG22_02985 [Prolixibacteraceae bacterium]|nr:hypothetical protein [Prolixibacteraceae bacterium]
MKMKDLKKAWSQVSADNDGRDKLTEEKIQAMLSKRTSSLIERIDKNLKTGFVIVFVLIIFTVLGEIIFRKLSPESYLDSKIPQWIIVASGIFNIFILGVFLFIFFKYLQVKKRGLISGNLRKTLKKMISLLTMYKRLLSMALFIVVILFAAAFMTGVYIGLGANKPDIATTIGLMSICVLIFALVALMFYLLLRWIFHKAYGAYLTKLKKTLKELDELE